MQKEWPIIGCHVGVIMLFLKESNMTQKELQNACWRACYQTGDLDFVKQCVAQGLDINARAEISGAVP